MERGEPRSPREARSHTAPRRSAAHSRRRRGSRCGGGLAPGIRHRRECARLARARRRERAPRRVCWGGSARHDCVTRVHAAIGRRGAREAKREEEGAARAASRAAAPHSGGGGGGTAAHPVARLWIRMQRRCRCRVGGAAGARSHSRRPHPRLRRGGAGNARDGDRDREFTAAGGEAARRGDQGGRRCPRVFGLGLRRLSPPNLCSALHEGAERRRNLHGARRRRAFRRRCATRRHSCRCARGSRCADASVRRARGGCVHYHGQRRQHYLLR